MSVETDELACVLAECASQKKLVYVAALELTHMHSGERPEPLNTMYLSRREAVSTHVFEVFLYDIGLSYVVYGTVKNVAIRCGTRRDVPGVRRAC